MQLTNALKAGGVAVALAITAAVAVGQLSPGPEASAGHIRAGSAAVGSSTIWATTLASPQVLAVYGIDAGAAKYVRVKVCAQPVDGGADVDPGQYAIPGLVVVYDDDTSQSCTLTDAALEAWTQDRADAPWLCACARDATCTSQRPDGGVGPAPLGLTLGPGAWAGSGCAPKTCIELSGQTSWLDACPLH